MRKRGRLRWRLAAAGVGALVCGVTGPPETGRATTAKGASWWGRVGAVADGDTITVVRKQRWPTRISLHGIDAPELDQPFGQQAKRLLSKLAFGKQVLVSVVGEDRQAKALVARVSIGGLGLSEALLTAGLAWHDRCRGGGAYKALEEAARKAQRGLWRGANPVAPWGHREAPRSGNLKKAPCAALIKPTATSGLEGALRRIGAPASSPARPKASPDLVCRRDRDCVFAYRDPCFCSPCGSAWRRVTNRASYQRSKRIWSIKVPACAPCPLCPRPTHWRGTKPVCVKRQCAVR